MSDAYGVPDRQVVLIHGLWRRPQSLRPFAEALHAAGYDVLSYRYRSRFKTVAQLGAGLRDWLGKRAPQGRGAFSFVTHSLGGILLRVALAPPAPVDVGRIVMLAPPNHGVGGLRRFAGTPLPALIYGRPAAELHPGSALFDNLPIPQAEIGIVAGTLGLSAANPNSWANAALGDQAASDGTVEVESTRLPVPHAFCTVAATHGRLCRDPRAIAQTLSFLQTGRFREL
ncbi:MAG: alpha/beta hydrolase [Alphaproteobacteria bacterium]